MASEAPSWADQWGAGGFGAMEEDGSTAKPDAGSNKKATKTGALAKAKSAASTGAIKIKLGVSKGMKWIKQKCQKKSAKTSDNNTV